MCAFAVKAGMNLTQFKTFSDGFNINESTANGDSQRS